MPILTERIDSDINLSNWKTNLAELQKLRGIDEVPVISAKIGKSQMTEIAISLTKERNLKRKHQ